MKRGWGRCKVRSRWRELLVVEVEATRATDESKNERERGSWLAFDVTGPTRWPYHPTGVSGGSWKV